MVVSLTKWLHPPPSSSSSSMDVLWLCVVESFHECCHTTKNAIVTRINEQFVWTQTQRRVDDMLTSFLSASVCALWGHRLGLWEPGLQNNKAYMWREPLPKRTEKMWVYSFMTLSRRGTLSRSKPNRYIYLSCDPSRAEPSSNTCNVEVNIWVASLILYTGSTETSRQQQLLTEPSRAAPKLWFIEWVGLGCLLKVNLLKFLSRPVLFRQNFPKSCCLAKFSRFLDSS